MNIKNLRTGMAAAMGGAVLLAGLMVGASLAFAQESEEPEDAAGASAIEEITADLLNDIDPLVDQIKDRVLLALDEAAAAEIMTEEQAKALKEGIEGFELPDEFPLPMHRFGLDEGLNLDGDCFRFRFGPEGAEADGDCPDFKLPEGFPFGPEGLEFEGRPFGFFGDEFDGFLEDLDVDLDGLLERLGSGMNLEESLADLDIDLELLLSDARIDATKELDKLVEDGKITQERADSIKEMLEGIDLSEGLPFGLRDFEFDFGDFNIEGFDFENFDFGEFDFDGFHGPRGHGHSFDFFGNDGSTGEVNADEVVFDV
jgi:hypothetical protein